MFPFLYYDVEPGYFTDVTNPPTLHVHVMRETFFIPFDISYKRAINDKSKMKFGFSFTKEPENFAGETMCYILNLGLEKKINKNSRFDFSFGGDLIFGHLEYSSYVWTGGHNSIGDIVSANMILVGVDVGISMQYNFSKRFFIQSESVLLFNYGSGTGKVPDYSIYPYNSRKVIQIDALGLVFSKLLGINVGYAFH